MHRASFPAAISTNGSSRRVRFNVQDADQYRHVLEFNPNRQTRSTDDVRLTEKPSIHRVEVEIPVRQGTFKRMTNNGMSISFMIAMKPWSDGRCSDRSISPAKTRSLTSQKIDINRSNNNLMRLQGIAPFIDAELHPNAVSQ
jgi:hypothetical protein